jgi:nicotinate-nucleotide pyrophosphorylase (carboxylating)
MKNGFLDPSLLVCARSIIETALREDLGSGDVTTNSTVGPNTMANARIVAKQDVRVCGVPLWEIALTLVGERSTDRSLVAEGTTLSSGQQLASLSCNARALLSTERVVMNLVCHLTGIATLTATFMEHAGDLKILDTRKTTPGLRALEKYAVRVGGGFNHRLGLDGGVLIKENHIASAGSVEAAVTRAGIQAPHSLRIQCEVTTHDEAKRAIDAGADALLLDNMSDEELKSCARDFGAQVFLEASGNMNLSRVKALAPLAQEGLHAVSVGALIHSRPYADLSMRMELAT